MNSRLLVRLLSYAPRPGRVAAEDFFTEAFVAVLQSNRDLLPEILHYGRSLKRLTKDFRLPQDVFLTTQFRGFRQGRPDIAVLDGHKIPRLIIENKLWAPFTVTQSPQTATDADETDPSGPSWEYQIPKYVEQLESTVSDGNAAVLLLSQSPRTVTFPGGQEHPSYLGNMLWSDVYAVLNAARTKSPGGTVSRFLLDELIALMEYLNMKTPPPLRYQAEIVWNYLDLMNTFRALNDAVCDQLQRDYAVERASRSPARGAFAYQDMKLPSFTVGVAIVPSRKGEDAGAIWPTLYLPPPSTDRDSPAERANQILGGGDPGEVEGWPGRCCWPSEDQLKGILTAADWHEQVKHTVAVFEGWFKTLQAEGLVSRRQTA